MQLFFIEDFNGQLEITGEDAFHLVKVLRKKTGDKIEITDGKGKGFEGIITDLKKDSVSFSLGKELVSNAGLKIKMHLAVAPTKNADRYEWMTEKAVEMGVNEITPIICERSERKNCNTERLRKIVLSAMKQSGRFYLPKINEPVKLKDFQSSAKQNLVAHCMDLHKKDISAIDFSDSVCLLIGPEGDFSPNEIEYLMAKNYLPVALGNSRLRTETAGVYAMGVVRSKG